MAVRKSTPGSQFIVSFKHHFEKILLTSSVWGRGGKQPNGLCEGHAYSMLQIVTLKDNNGQTVQLLRIRNPWGNGFEWSGDWSDSSAKWGSISCK